MLHFYFPSSWDQPVAVILSDRVTGTPQGPSVAVTASQASFPQLQAHSGASPSVGYLLKECILIVTPAEAKSNYRDKSASKKKKKIDPNMKFTAKYMRLKDSQLLEAWSSLPLLQRRESDPSKGVPR